MLLDIETTTFSPQCPLFSLELVKGVLVNVRITFGSTFKSSDFFAFRSSEDTCKNINVGQEPINRLLRRTKRLKCDVQPSQKRQTLAVMFDISF